MWVRSSLGMEGYMDDPDLDAERMRDGYISVKDVGYLDERRLPARRRPRRRHDHLGRRERVPRRDRDRAERASATSTRRRSSACPTRSGASASSPPSSRPATITEDELIGWAKENAAYAAVPKEIRFMDALPRNDIGKVDKKATRPGMGARRAQDAARTCIADLPRGDGGARRRAAHARRSRLAQGDAGRRLGHARHDRAPRRHERHHVRIGHRGTRSRPHDRSDGAVARSRRRLRRHRPETVDVFTAWQVERGRGRWRGRTSTRGGRSRASSCTTCSAPSTRRAGTRGGRT